MVKRYYQKLVTRWILYYSLLVLFSVLGTYFGLPIVPAFSTILLVTFFVNITLPRTSENNLIFILGSYIILPFSYRLQYGNGLADETNFISVTLEVITIFAFVYETLNSPRIKNKLWYLSIAFILMFMLQYRDLSFAIQNKFHIAYLRNYLILFIAVSVGLKSKHLDYIHAVIKVLLIASSVDISYALYQYIFSIPTFEMFTIYAKSHDAMVLWDNYYKMISLNGVGYGIYYNLVFFLIFDYHYARYQSRKILIIFNLIMCFALLLTFTERTAVIMFLISTVAYFSMKSENPSIKKIIGRIIVAMALLLMINQLITPVLQKYGSIGLKQQRIAEISNIAESGTMKTRIAKHWVKARNDFPKQWLFGDNFRNQYEYHNEYFNIFLSLGIFGFLAWIILLRHILIELFSIYSFYKPTSLLFSINFALLCYYFALLAAAIPDNPFQYTSGLLFFSLSGLTIGFTNNQVQP
jgi:hypothetical protein